MAPWWAWLLLWIVLLAGSAVLLTVRARSTWHSFRRLRSVAADASAEVSEALDSADRRAPAPLRPWPSLFAERGDLADERDALLAATRRERAARRAARRPGWAGRID